MKTIYMVNTGATDVDQFGVIAFTSLKKVAKWLEQYLHDHGIYYLYDCDLYERMKQRNEKGWVSLLEGDDLPESLDIIVYESTLDEKY